jgi:hypothetical protein
MDHCHDCGQDEKIDQCAAVCADLVQYCPEDEEDKAVIKKAMTFLADYITYRQSSLTSSRMPRL